MVEKRYASISRPLVEISRRGNGGIDMTTQNDREELVKRLPCCGYWDTLAVVWNELNGVVQCHNCGQVYAPLTAPAVPAAQAINCGNCSGLGYDIVGVVGADGKTHNRQCHVCGGTGKAAQPDAELPELDAFDYERSDVPAEVNLYIDALRARCVAAEADAQRKYEHYQFELARANTLESRLKRLVEGLRKPSEEMQIAGANSMNDKYAAGFICHIWKAMSAALLREVDSAALNKEKP